MSLYYFEQKQLGSGEKLRIVGPDKQATDYTINSALYYSIMVRMPVITFEEIYRLLAHLYDHDQFDPICLFYSPDDRKVFGVTQSIIDFVHREIRQQQSCLVGFDHPITKNRIDLIELSSLNQGRIMLGFFQARRQSTTG